jgi:hypothetical protein
MALSADEFFRKKKHSAMRRGAHAMNFGAKLITDSDFSESWWDFAPDE